MVLSFLAQSLERRGFKIGRGFLLTALGGITFANIAYRLSSPSALPKRDLPPPAKQQ